MMQFYAHWIAVVAALMVLLAPVQGFAPQNWTALKAAVDDHMRDATHALKTYGVAIGE